MKRTMIIFLTFALSLLFTSCAKQGCTDSDADNYDPKAKAEDYSCHYTGYHLIYYGYDVARFLSQYTTYLHITTSSGQYLVHRADSYAIIPYIGNEGCIQLEQSGGTKHFGSDYVVIKDDDGDNVWTGYVEYGVRRAQTTELYLN